MLAIICNKKGTGIVTLLEAIYIISHLIQRLISRAQVLAFYHRDLFLNTFRWYHGGLSACSGCKPACHHMVEVYIISCKQWFTILYFTLTFLFTFFVLILNTQWLDKNSLTYHSKTQNTNLYLQRVPIFINNFIVSSDLKTLFSIALHYIKHPFPFGVSLSEKSELKPWNAVDDVVLN
jgi:hypothetical protein